LINCRTSHRPKTDNYRISVFFSHPQRGNVTT
jgi:hypothetical protein